MTHTTGDGPGAARFLRDTLSQAVPMLRRLTDDQASLSPPGKWSPKQVLGHLIDSASNNHQRFVRAQFSPDMIHPGYEQERWVETQKYGDAPWDSLITLFEAFNRHLAWVMESAPADVLEVPRLRHNLDQIAWTPVPTDQPATLAYFMNDYVGHLRHHLRQIFPGFGD